MTDERRTLYVVPPSATDSSVTSIKKWAKPPTVDGRAEPPAASDILEYLQAFYHGLEVRMLSSPKLKFTAWHEDEKAQRKRAKGHDLPPIALSTGSEAIRISTRPSHDGMFPGRLGLNDLLDTAISILPDDAYALLMVVEQDLFEDDDDDFCCGRAYGGSRVAVVSMARYNPLLDEEQGVEREHAWPASHCQDYVERCCNDGQARKKKQKLTKENNTKITQGSAMAKAVEAYNAFISPSTSNELTTLWLNRVCKTASHELGHCLGMDHCVYYACLMQGTAGLSEDARQPPILCLVDNAKVMRAISATLKNQWELEWKRNRALLDFCERFEGTDRLFAAYAAWLTHRLQELEDDASNEWEAYRIPYITISRVSAVQANPTIHPQTPPPPQYTYISSPAHT